MKQFKIFNVVSGNNALGCSITNKQNAKNKQLNKQTNKKTCMQCMLKT